LTGQPNVNAEEYGRLELPKPPLDVQVGIVRQYDAALLSYKAKIEQADALLASIDDYLLAELDITLPPEPDNAIANRIFRTKASDLAGWRFDARVHQYDFNLLSVTYPNVKLGTICAINPKTVFRGLTETDDVSFVPMDAISDRLGIIEKPDTRILAENVGYTSFREGDLLWAKITPCMENGKSAVANGLHRGFGYGSTEYHVLRSPDGSLDMGYLHAILRMKRVRKAAVRFFTGASGHQRVDADFLRTLELPVPPLDVQKELAAEARARVARAVKLEEEANAELERAKAEIEAILLGDAA
jgi:type I restriction enzyme S subunit